MATGKNEIAAFMKRFSFATIVTAKDGFPVASHLPFLITVVNDEIVLTAHFAKANEQWKDIETCKVLVVFSEPHAYISPKHYDKELNVPTWNYLSVHAYGEGKIINRTEEIFSVLETTIDNYEAAYQKQWNSLPQDYKMKMLKGIVAFQVTVSDLQAKKKLSQNKSEAEQQRIIDELSKSNDTNEKLTAEYMVKQLQGKIRSIPLT